MSALAEGDKLTMLYKIKEGVIDRSYGIHVAEMLKFPEEVLREAKQLASELENFNDVEEGGAGGGQGAEPGSEIVGAKHESQAVGAPAAIKDSNNGSDPAQMKQEGKVIDGIMKE